MFWRELGTLKLHFLQQTFNKAEVWRLGRTLHDLNVVPLLCWHGCLFWVVVMLEDPHKPVFSVLVEGGRFCSKLLQYMVTSLGLSMWWSCSVTLAVSLLNIFNSVLDCVCSLGNTKHFSSSNHGGSSWCQRARFWFYLNFEHRSFSQAFSELFRGSLTNLRLVCTCVFMRKEMGSAKFKSIQCIVLIMVFLVTVVLLLRYEWEQC